MNQLAHKQIYDEYLPFDQTQDIGLLKLFLGAKERFRVAALSDHQIKLFEWVRGHKEPIITARMLADKKGLSVQSASFQLLNLWKKGYLLRRGVITDNNSLEYWYLSAI